jgi:cytoskeletal protein CcmA (bactofilin family)
MGAVHGNIEATDRLEIHENGKLYGNIRTAKLKIADGVVFEGKCEMIKAAERKSEPKQTSPKPEKEAVSSETEKKPST